MPAFLIRHLDYVRILLSAFSYIVRIHLSNIPNLTQANQMPFGGDAMLDGSYVLQNQLIHYP